MICPHPDDELIGAGGVMLKYPNNFDVCCISSSGVQYANISAEQRANIRINEFNHVMDMLGIKNRWIFKTFGVPPFIGQIKKMFEEYCNVLDTKKYDYIFMPIPYDNHPEHKYITNELAKNIIKNNGYKTDAKIVFYEVWSPIYNANYYEDISSVIAKKCTLLDSYISQNVFINYSYRIKSLNIYRGMLAGNWDYAEAFRIISVQNYLKGKM